MRVNLENASVVAEINEREVLDALLDIPTETQSAVLSVVLHRLTAVMGALPDTEFAKISTPARVNIARTLHALANRVFPPPDTLGEALNSGDGSCRR